MSDLQEEREAMRKTPLLFFSFNLTEAWNDFQRWLQLRRARREWRRRKRARRRTRPPVG